MVLLSSKFAIEPSKVKVLKCTIIVLFEQFFLYLLIGIEKRGILDTLAVFLGFLRNVSSLYVIFSSALHSVLSRHDPVNIQMSGSTPI